ncbi:alpha/beta hydrolase [Agromyces sp. MMS24-K17]|uniref:alpha/beta hydrolase n=1 Tax=Agromyces sp. MMS24-K17 TaxID=3372850 RepID=UPI0037546D4D
MTKVDRRWLAAAVLPLALLAGCASGGAAGEEPAPEASAAPSPSAASTETRVRDVAYWEGDGGPLAIDACLPDADQRAAAGTADDEALPAVLLLHGGGFVSGDRTALAGLCDQLAAAGYAAFSADYRFAPASVFPAQVEDVEAAVAWLRDDAQVERFGIDPARIGVVGSSAGAILAQSIGTFGEGDTTTGTRVAAVVSLSGASLFTEAALTLGTPTREVAAMMLNYLGCEETTAAACPQAAEASPLEHVDPTDPPFLLVNSTDEIVPVEQAEAMRDALAAAGVRAELLEVPGELHGVDVLREDGSEQLLAFLASTLRAG